METGVLYVQSKQKREQSNSNDLAMVSLLLRLNMFHTLL